MFISSKFITAAASIALLTTGGIGVGAAFAQAPVEASGEAFVSNGRTSAVYHGDLNLNDAGDQRQLRSRVIRAANRVCSSSDLSVEQACKAKATAQVQAPVSAAIARAETGERYADAGQGLHPIVKH